MLKLTNDDCLVALKEMEANSVDSLVTDPPAGISFMGKDWDHDKGGRDNWIAWMTEAMTESMRVMKPGAHGLVWALPRTSHWTATALENAGFEVRDVVTHIFGTGFPKSLDISKAIDKAAGAHREIIGVNPNHRRLQETGTMRGQPHVGDGGITCPVTEYAKQWQGWGTALKPASEHWILVRKKCSEKTVAANVLKHGCGGLNIDASRIEVGPEGLTKGGCTKVGGMFGSGNEVTKPDGHALGRFPANFVLSHNEDCEYVGQAKFKRIGGGPHQKKERVGVQGSGSVWTMPGNCLIRQSYNDITGETVEKFNCSEDCAVKMLNEQSGPCKTGNIKPGTIQGFGTGKNCYGEGSIPREYKTDVASGASRFFYVAKASKADRNAGLPEGEKSSHPTVKSTKLMDYLIKLITPPNGVVLDPFMGSGSTGVSARRLGFGFAGIEQSKDYFEIASKRICNVESTSKED
jgi:site-specific DNA-methyltransferase (adenine-specific)